MVREAGRGSENERRRRDRAWLLAVVLIIGAVCVTALERPSGAATAGTEPAPACADGSTATVIDLPSGSQEALCRATTAAVDPAIELSKTVGTDESTCASTDEISVVADTEVFYCFSVENTGGVTMTVHDLDDDKLGTLLDGFEFELAPGASTFVTRSATIAEDTVNVATWSATDGSALATSTDTASVIVLAADVPGAPTIGTVGATEGSISVAWSPPADDGGSPVTGYVVRALAGATEVARLDVDADARSAVLDGLANGTAHTVTVAAENAAGLGPEDDAGPVTPQWWLPWSSGPVAVQQLFTWFTGTPPTSAQQSAWLAQLDGGTALPGDLVAALRTGADATTNVDPVVRLYSAYLTRIPDASGLNFWLGRRRSGWTLAEISSSFAGSSEFQRRYGSLTNRQFVEQIYLNVLGRPGDPGGISFWTGQLDRAVRSRGQVMLNFSESSEYVGKQADNVDAAVVYIHLLGRAPTIVERTAFTTALDGGTSLATLVRREIARPSFDARAG